MQASGRGRDARFRFCALLRSRRQKQIINALLFEQDGDGIGHENQDLARIADVRASSKTTLQIACIYVLQAARLDLIELASAIRKSLFKS